MKKIVKIVALILAVCASYQTVIVYAAGGKAREPVTREPPGP